MISLSELARVMHTYGIRNLLHALGNEHITRHGSRSTFRDWTGEKTPSREISASSLWPMTSAGKRKVRTFDQTF
jgi:hypothetical protein